MIKFDWDFGSSRFKFSCSEFNFKISVVKVKLWLRKTKGEDWLT